VLDDDLGFQQPPKREKKEKPPAEKPWIHPSIVIAVFVISVIAAIAGYIAINYKEPIVKAQKKLSKKKVRQVTVIVMVMI
jgi:hypothetical protein